MNIRFILASLSSTVILLAPGCVALLYEPNPGPSNANDSWQQGVVLLPFFFAATAFTCLRVGQILLSKGHRSIRGFTSRASVFAAAAALLLSAPAAIVGCAVGLLAPQTALVCVIVFVALLAFVTIPAAAAWWLVAGVNAIQANEAAV